MDNLEIPIPTDFHMQLAEIFGAFPAAKEQFKFIGHRYIIKGST